MNNDFDAAMSALSPTGALRDSESSAIKKPLGSSFLGDAILNIKISVATTGTIPSNLSFPVYLFGAVHFASNYKDVLQSSPSDYALTVSTVNGGDVAFSYDFDALNLTATVSSSTLAYKSILDATLTDFMKTNAIRASVTPSANADAQFSEPFVTFEKSIFGGVKENSIDVDINKSPENFQANIVDIVESIQIDGKRGIAVNVNSATTQYNLNIGTSQYYKAQANF